MRKLLAGFLLPLRWLLVPLLPVLGLFVGWWMIPQARPNWERTLDDYVYCTGIRNDGTKSCLVAFDQRFVKEEGKIYQRIIGLDGTNGKDFFNKKLHCDSFTRLVLVPGTSYALRWGFSDPDSLVLYDWEKEVVHRQLTTGVRLSQVILPVMKNNVLTAVIGGPTLTTIACWRLGNHSKADLIKIASESPFLRDLALSSSGDWLVASSQIISGVPGAPVQYRVELFDTKQGKKKQTLSTQIERICWLDEADAFLPCIETK